MTEKKRLRDNLPLALRRLEAITSRPNKKMHDIDRRADTKEFESTVMQRLDSLEVLAMFTGTKAARQLCSPNLPVMQVETSHAVFLPPQGRIDLYVAYHIPRAAIEYEADLALAVRPITTVQTLQNDEMKIWYVKHKDRLYYHNHRDSALYRCRPRQLANLDSLIEIISDQDNHLQIIPETNDPAL